MAERRGMIDCWANAFLPDREALWDASLEAQVLKSDNSALAKDCEKECAALRRRLTKLGPRDRAERNETRRELRRLIIIGFRY